MATVDPTITQNPASSPFPQQPSGIAFERVKPELEALAKDDLVRVTLDVFKAGVNAKGKIPRIMAFREDIVRDAPSFDITVLDKLQDYANAMAHADAIAAPPKVDASLQKLLDEAATLRESMLAASVGLAHVGLLDQDKLAEVRKGTGQLDMVRDLMALFDMYRSSWSTIEGKSALTRDEVVRAGALAEELSNVVGEKNTRNELGERRVSAAAADMRARAFTLFINAYEACRTVIHYIRHKHGDAESIAPTVFVRGRRKSSSKESADADDTLVPGAPGAQPSPAPAPAGDETD